MNGRRVRAGWWRHCLALAAACQIVGLAVPCQSAAPDAPVPDAPVSAAAQPAALEPAPAPAHTGAQAAGRGRDLIGAADLLEVRVFELPELQSSVRVKADGTISLPLIGSLAVAGMTEADAEASLKSVLADRYVKDPHVSVLVKEHESRKVSVIGAVVRPGAYPLLAERSLLQMISEAGGLTREAGAHMLVIRNSGTAEGERLRVDLEKLVVEGDPAANIAVQPGDIINVLADESIYIYVDGAVKSPGQIETRASRPITLLQALIRSGGTTDAANPKQVRVLRKADDGSRETLVVDTRKIRRGKQDDIVLRDGDVVVVPEALF
ncbi:MAG: polysaccharide biosynthesis/export family protein [Acidobacteriota bacterium]